MTYIPHTDLERQQMLAAIGVPTIEDLFEAVPSKYRFPYLDLPAPMSEMEIISELRALQRSQRPRAGFRHLSRRGSLPALHPAAVNHIMLRGEFLTAYTPYQPEVSQGTLQAIFEYQTMITQLTGMDGANASHYDGATSLAESVTVALEASRHKRTQGHPQPRHSPALPRRDPHLSSGQRRRNSSATTSDADDQRSGRPARRQHGDAGGRLPELPRSNRGLHRARPESPRGGRAAGLRRQSAGAGAAQKPRRTRRGHRRRRGAAARHPAELRRTLRRLLRHQNGADSPHRRTHRRRDARRRRQQGLRHDAAPARAGHPPREGDQQHLHQSGLDGAGGDGLHGADGQERAAPSDRTVLEQVALRRRPDRPARRLLGRSAASRSSTSSSSPARCRSQQINDACC